MQDGVSEDSMWNEVEQALSGMGRREKLVLVLDDVSLRWHSILVMNYLCPSARHVIVTCGSKCHLVFLCACVCK